MKEQTIIKNKDKMLTKSPSASGELLYGKGVSDTVKKKYKEQNLNENK